MLESSGRAQTIGHAHFARVAILARLGDITRCGASRALARWNNRTRHVWISTRVL